MSKPEPVASKSLDALIDGFALKEPLERESLTNGVPLTLWLPRRYKERYVELQRLSDRRFCKVIRELIKAAIDRCDTEAVA